MQDINRVCLFNKNSGNNSDIIQTYQNLIQTFELPELNNQNFI